jgi:ATP-dependent RNA helicase SUPV3L1/SUV3
MSFDPLPEFTTHADQLTAARLALLDSFGIADSEFAQSFLRLPIHHKARVSGVRASLARFACEHLLENGARFEAYSEADDTVAVRVPAELTLRNALRLPVAMISRVPLAELARAVARDDEEIRTNLLRTEELDEVSQRLQSNPPGYAGWAKVQQQDIDRTFDPDPPVANDPKELYRRIKQACALAADRELLDELAQKNPGFIDYLQCFPVARRMQRRVVAWLGPTNSGKTFRAMEEMRGAESGMYLGPLRLLALEQRDRLADLGRACSLITGEERDEVSRTHSARTVEMADFSRRYEVCVLDEMHLAFDRDRGWAWVAAFCGVAAERLIVTGPRSTEAVIRRLAGLCGDTLEVHYLERQGTLAFEGVLDWRRVPPRSAVIGFSRAMVLELKAMFESRGHRVSVIYGGLTPEVRRNEARRFRDGESDIVCATDAIGMGLNLPLDRVIFYETDKFDGEVDRALTHAEILQIGGRAGRGPGADGLVSAFSARDARRIEAALARPQSVPEMEQLPAAPTSMHVRAIAEHLGLDRLQPILEFFRTRLTFPEGTFLPEVQEAVFEAAELVDSYAPNLPIEQRYALACTPIDLDEHAFRNAFAEWLESLGTGRAARFPRYLQSGDGLDGLEEMLQLVTIYRWLSLKFPESFVDVEQVEQLRRSGIEQTQAILRRNWSQHGLRRRECSTCGRALLPGSPHRNCRQCRSGA